MRDVWTAIQEPQPAAQTPSREAHQVIDAIDSDEERPELCDSSDDEGTQTQDIDEERLKLRGKLEKRYSSTTPMNTAE